MRIALECLPIRPSYWQLYLRRLYQRIYICRFASTLSTTRASRKKTPVTSSSFNTDDNLFEDGSSKTEHDNRGILIDYFEYKKKYPFSEKFLLLYQIGDFYEFYGPDALVASQILGIGLTTKRVFPPFLKYLFSQYPESAPTHSLEQGQTLVLYFTGVPVSSFEAGSHVRKLVLENPYKLAICDQFPSSDPHSPRRFERHITRVITPGTLSEDNVLSSSSNNYLLSVSLISTEAIGLAWIDISTGEFSSSITSLKGIEQYLIKLSPKEVIMDARTASLLSPIIEGCNRTNTNIALTVKSFTEPTLKQAQFFCNKFANKIPNKELTGKEDLTECSLADQEITALIQMTAYMQETQGIDTVNRFFNSIFTESTKGLPSMHIDSQTFRSLEILTGAQTGTGKGSLLDILNETSTPPGSRLLSQWLRLPLIDITEISTRLGAIEYFISKPQLIENLRVELKRLVDYERHLNVFLLRPLASCTALRSIAVIKDTLQRSRKLLSTLRNDYVQHVDNTILVFILKAIVDGIDTKLDLLLSETLVEEIPGRLSDGNFISQT